MATQTILVTAATGTVGRPLTHKLLSMGHKVHALTTNPTSDRALDIQRAGATLFRGALNDKTAIAAAAASCTGLYLNPMPANMAEHFSEATFAQNTIEVCRAAGVKTCVSQSVEGADTIHSMPQWSEWISTSGIAAHYWNMKLDTLNAVRNAGFDNWTSIQGGMHLSNFGLRYLAMLFPGVRDSPVGTMSFPVKPSTRLHLIDPSDLAELAARAFTEPQRYSGQAFNAVGEELTLAQITEVVSKHAGKPLKAHHPDLAEVMADRGKSLGSANGLVLDLFGERSELEACRAFGIKCGTLDEYLKDREDELKQAVA